MSTPKANAGHTPLQIVRAWANLAGTVSHLAQGVPAGRPTSAENLQSYVRGLPPEKRADVLDQANTVQAGRAMRKNAAPGALKR